MTYENSSGSETKCVAAEALTRLVKGIRTCNEARLCVLVDKMDSRTRGTEFPGAVLDFSRTGLRVYFLST